MSTKYHIRTFSSVLSGGLSTPGYSTDNILEVYNEAALGAAAAYGMRTRPSTVFNTTAQELLGLALVTSTRQSPPQYTVMDSSHTFKVSTTAGYLYWSNYNGNWDAGANWSTYGWSSPNTLYSTWLAEICAKFNTHRAATENSHDNNYNVYVFKYTQDSVTFYYFPIFTKGNDPAYQTLITI